MTTPFELSTEEAQAIGSSWDVVKSDLKGIGVTVLFQFFSKYPDYLKKFRAFAKVPQADLPTNKRFIAHSYTVMVSLNGLVEALDDIDMLTELLLKNGQNHGKLQLTKQDFQIFQDFLLGFFKANLPANLYTPVAETAWTKVLTHMTETISEGIDSLNY